MADTQTTSTAADPPGGAKTKGKPKTIGGLPVPVVIAGGLAFAIAAVYFLMHRSAASSSSAGTAGDTTASGANSPADDSAALADIEQQLADLNGQLGGGSSGGGGSDGGGGLTGTTGDGGGTGTGTGTGSGGSAPNPLDKLHQTTVGGKGATRDLYQIARDNGITEAELVKLNPQLKRYVGTKKPIPKRQKIIV